jgi:hypothetical protein
VAELAIDGTHQAPLYTHDTSTKQRSFPHRRLCCPPGSTSTTTASDSLPAGHPFPEVIGYRTPRSGDTYPQATGPGRVSPVPAATIDTFHAPYAGEFLGTCISRSSVPSMAFTVISAARHSLHPPLTRRTSNDAAGFASCCGPHLRSPRRAFDTGLRPHQLPDEAASLLPGPPGSYPDRTFHRQATTSLRTNQSPTRGDLLFSWTHESPGLTPTGTRNYNRTGPTPCVRRTAPAELRSRGPLQSSDRIDAGRQRFAWLSRAQRSA